MLSPCYLHLLTCPLAQCTEGLGSRQTPPVFVCLCLLCDASLVKRQQLRDLESTVSGHLRMKRCLVVCVCFTATPQFWNGYLFNERKTRWRRVANHHAEFSSHWFGQILPSKILFTAQPQAPYNTWSDRIISYSPDMKSNSIWGSSLIMY